VLRSVDGWRWYAFLFGLAVQTSTAATSVLAVGAAVWAVAHFRLCLVSWSAPRLRLILLAVGALAVVVVLGVPVALINGYSPWPMLFKHLPFVFFFLLVALLRTPERRGMLLLGFLLGAVLALLTSLYSAAIDLPLLNGSPGDFNTFRKHAEHNMFVGLGAFSVAVWLLPQRPGRWQILGWLFFWLACFDIFCLVQGRTGQVVFVPLLAWVVIDLVRRRRLTLAAVTVAVAVASITPGILGRQSAVATGIEMAQQNIATYQEGRAKTSVAYRLDFAKTTWRMILERPWLGYGTGGFVPAYADYVSAHDPRQETTHNPHNDYLFYWVESGLAGLLAVIFFYTAIILVAWRIGGLRGIGLGALAMVWSVSGLAYSMLLDHPTRYALFALLAALITGPLPFGERQRPLFGER
jgi:O-antigen ligase